MRFIDVKLQCGWLSCDTVASEGEGLVISRIIALDGKTPREIELCKQHSDDLDEILAPLFEDGRPAEPRKKKSSGSKKTPLGDIELTDADLVCKHPECKMTRPSKSRAGLAQHVIRAHGYDDLRDYLNEYPPSASG